MIRKHHLLYLTILYCCFTACTSDRSVPIEFGKDQCEFCRMSIADQQYGSELITDKGRVLKYDAAECMISQLTKESVAYQSLYAVPYDEPKTLKPVDSLVFVIDQQFRSPMGASLAAFSDVRNIPKDAQGLSWKDLVKKLSY